MTSVWDKQFHQMFRMSKLCFNSLCDRLNDAVGHECFKSEDYLSSTKGLSMYESHMLSSGGFISGEIKVAITLRFLGGGSYLDIEKIFHISFKSAYRIFIYVLHNWI